MLRLDDLVPEPNENVTKLNFTDATTSLAVMAVLP